MKNAMQLKAIIKNIAKEKHISAQLVMQNFMLFLHDIKYSLQNIDIPKRNNFSAFKRE